MELSDTLSTSAIPLKTCRLIVDNTVMKSTNAVTAASKIGIRVQKIKSKLHKGSMESLLKLQRSSMYISHSHIAVAAGMREKETVFHLYYDITQCVFLR